MLALQSSMQSSGFSVMDADELFFINGGSTPNSNSPTNSGNNGTDDQKGGGCQCTNCGCQPDINIYIEGDNNTIGNNNNNGDKNSNNGIGNQGSGDGSNGGGSSGFWGAVVNFFAGLFK